MNESKETILGALAKNSMPELNAIKHIFDRAWGKLGKGFTERAEGSSEIHSIRTVDASVQRNWHVSWLVEYMNMEMNVHAVRDVLTLHLTSESGPRGCPDLTVALFGVRPWSRRMAAKIVADAIRSRVFPSTRYETTDAHNRLARSMLLTLVGDELEVEWGSSPAVSSRLTDFLGTKMGIGINVVIMNRLLELPFEAAEFGEYLESAKQVLNYNYRNAHPEKFPQWSRPTNRVISIDSYLEPTSLTIAYGFFDPPEPRGLNVKLDSDIKDWDIFYKLTVPISNLERLCVHSLGEFLARGSWMLDHVDDLPLPKQASHSTLVIKNWMYKQVANPSVRFEMSRLLIENTGRLQEAQAKLADLVIESMSNDGVIHSPTLPGDAIIDLERRINDLPILNPANHKMVLILGLIRLSDKLAELEAKFKQTEPICGDPMVGGGGAAEYDWPPSPVTLYSNAP